MHISESKSGKPLRFDNRVMIVTGAGRGMGRDHALLLAARGAKVVVNDVGLATMHGGDTSAGPAEAVAKEIIEAGGEAVVSTDTVATPEGAQAIIDRAMKQWGRVDGIIHNAGIARFAPVEDTDINDYRAVLAVSLDAALYLTKAAWPIMQAQNFGKLLYITSSGGLIGTANNTPYAIAKTGMLGLMNVARIEGAAHNIAVNMLGVGAYTRMVEGMFGEDEPGRSMAEWWRRYVRPDLVAPVAAWLLHEDCETSGAILYASGGHVSRSFLAETRGYTKLDLSIEDVRDNQPMINDQSNYYVRDKIVEVQETLVAHLIGAGADQVSFKPLVDLK